MDTYYVVIIYNLVLGLDVTKIAKPSIPNLRLGLNGNSIPLINY